MIKTLKNLFKQDKEKFVVPKSVQAVIPIKTIWEDGVFLVGKNKYAKQVIACMMKQRWNVCSIFCFSRNWSFH